MPRPAFRLTSKIVILVAVMGLVSGFITLYATLHMQRIENNYHSLLMQQAAAGNKVGTLRRYPGDVAVQVHIGLMATNTDDVLNAHTQLRAMEQAFWADLGSLYPLLRNEHGLLNTLSQHAQDLFDASHLVINTNLAWRDGREASVLSQQFAPALNQLQDDLNVLRNRAHQVFAKASEDIHALTQRTIRKTMLLAWCSFLVVTGVAAWFATRLLSRPIQRLTQSMQRMRFQKYEVAAEDLSRNDEIGSMARALQRFGEALKQAQSMEQTLAAHQADQLMAEQLTQLTSALPGAIFQMHLSPTQPLKLRFVSPQWVQLLGLPADTPNNVETASNTIRHYNPQVTLISEEQFVRSAQTLEPVNFEVSMVMRDGVTRWIQTLANPQKAEDGSVVFNGVWLDVSKQVHQARALEKAKRQAEQDAQARTTLQASISHEIRTPLNAILGMAQLILKADLPESQRERMTNVLRAAQHLRGIVNEVLDFSKIDAGQLQLESTDFNLQSVVHDMCREQAEQKGLSLLCNIDEAVPNSLRGDPHRIAQILLNYVNNAIKFTATGHIEISIQLDASSTLHRIVLRASVKDTGTGIPADRIPLLFEAFQQADNSITRRFGGTGLGLTISRALAQLMGGTAGVESTLGLGSTFWFTAVLEPARAPVSALPQPASPPMDMHVCWEGRRILVVDDNPLNRAVAEGMLQALGLQTDIAEDGAHALLKLQAVEPTYYSCVLMDIQMPHMDGYSATQALRKLPGFESLPVLAMTAHTGVQDVQRAYASGMNGHIGKPLLESALQQALYKVLASNQTAPVTPATTAAADEVLPVVFDATAVAALAQLFPAAKLQQLVAQFTQDSLQRVEQLASLLEQQDWPGIRAETHKLSGTAATFGLLQLGYWSSALSAAVKAEDSAALPELVSHVVESAQLGVKLLQQYTATSAKT